MSSSAPQDRKGFMPLVPRSRRTRDPDDPFDTQEFDDMYNPSGSSLPPAPASSQDPVQSRPALSYTQQPPPSGQATQRSKRDHDDEDHDDYDGSDDDYGNDEDNEVSSMRTEFYTYLLEMIDGLLERYDESHPIQNMDPDTVATNWEEHIWRSSAADDDYSDYMSRVRQELERGEDYTDDVQQDMREGVRHGRLAGELFYQVMQGYSNVVRENRPIAKMRSARQSGPAVDTSGFMPNPNYIHPETEQNRLNALAEMKRCKNDALNADTFDRRLSRVDKDRRQFRQSFQRQIRELVALLSTDDPLRNVHVVNLAAAMEDELWEEFGGSEDTEEYKNKAKDREIELQEWERYWGSDECDLVTLETGEQLFEACVRVTYDGRFIQSEDDLRDQSEDELGEEIARLGGFYSEDDTGAVDDADDESDAHFYSDDSNDGHHSPSQSDRHVGPIDDGYADRLLDEYFESTDPPPVHEQDGVTEDRESPLAAAEQTVETAVPAGQSNDGDASDTPPVGPSLLAPAPAPSTPHFPGISVENLAGSTVSQPQTSLLQADLPPQAIDPGGDGGSMDYEQTPADATVHVPQSQVSQVMQPIQQAQTLYQPIQAATCEDVEMGDMSHVSHTGQSRQPLQQTHASIQPSQSANSEDIDMADRAPDASIQQSRAIENVPSSAINLLSTGQKNGFDPSHNNPFMTAGYMENLKKQSDDFNRSLNMPPTKTSALFMAALGNKSSTVAPSVDDDPMQQSQSALPLISTSSQSLYGSGNFQASNSSGTPLVLDSADLSRLSAILATIPEQKEQSSLQSLVVPDATTSSQTLAGVSSPDETLTDSISPPKAAYATLPAFKAEFLSMPTIPTEPIQSFRGLTNPEDAFKQSSFSAAVKDESRPALFGSIDGGAQLNKPTLTPFTWNVPKDSTPLQPKSDDKVTPLFQFNKETTKSFNFFPSTQKEAAKPFTLFPTAEKDNEPRSIFNTIGLDFGVSAGPKTAGQSKIVINFANTDDLIKTPAVLQPSAEVSEEAPKAIEGQQLPAPANSVESVAGESSAPVPDEIVKDIVEDASAAPPEEPIVEAEEPKTAPAEPVQANEGVNTASLAPDSSREESEQPIEYVPEASSTPVSEPKVGDVGAELDVGREAVTEDQSVDEHDEIAHEDAEVQDPLSEESCNPSSEKESITAATQDDRSPPTLGLSGHTQEHQLLTIRIVSFGAATARLQKMIADMSAQTTALGDELREIKLYMANFANSTTTSVVEEPAQTSRIATEHEEKGPTAMSEEAGFEEIPQQPQESTSVTDRVPSSAVTQQNIDDAMYFGVDITNNTILHQGIKAPGLNISVGSEPEQSGGSAPAIPQDEEVVNDKPTATITDVAVSTGDTSQNEGVFRRGRKHRAKPIFDSSLSRELSPLPHLPPQDTPDLLLKNLLRGMNTWEAELLMLEFAGGEGEAKRVVARDTIKRKLADDEVAQLSLFIKDGRSESRLVKIGIAYRKACEIMESWDSMSKDGIPPSFLQVSEDLKTQCHTLLRFDCLATLRTLNKLVNKCCALHKIFKSHGRLVEVTAHTEILLPRWRWAETSEEKGRLREILNEKLAYAIKMYQKFYDAVRELEQRGPEFFTFNTLLSAQVCQNLVDNRLELTKWHRELNMSMPELSIDIYDDVEL